MKDLYKSLNSSIANDLVTKKAMDFKSIAFFYNDQMTVISHSADQAFCGCILPAISGRYQTVF
jgi:pyruvate-formate lyase